MQVLKKIEVNELGIVDKGAVDRIFAIYKSADTNSESIENFLGENEKMSKSEQLKKEDSPPELTEEEKKKKEEEEEERKKKEGEKKEEAAKSAPVKKCEEEKKKDETAKSAIMKEIQAELKKAVDEAVAPLRTENEELKKALDGEQAIRQTREFINKAATMLPNLGNPAEIGTLLMSIEKSNLGQSDKDKVNTILAQADKGFKYLTKSVGYTGPAPAEKSAAAEIQEKAQALIQKSDKKMDMAVARTEVRKMYPELAAREKAEERGIGMGVV